MTDRLLTSADQKASLSVVYAKAVAARAGYVTSVPDLDRDGVDLRIEAGGAMRPALDLQLKATARPGVPTWGSLTFALKRRNYDLLRVDTQTPRILVVLVLPDNRNRWMTITQEELVLRRSAYWLSLRGADETMNRSSLTVRLPVANLFDVDGLRRLMEQSRNGRIE